MSSSIRSRRFGLPLITILVFSVSLLLGFGKLLQESRDSRGDIKEMLYWSASQTVLEYWRFLGALDRYAAEPSGAALDQALLRLDLLWSRLAVYDSGEIGERLRMVEGSVETVAALGQTLREIEPRLRALRAGDASALAAIRERLTPHASPLHRMAQRTHLSEQARTVEFRVETGRTYWLLLALLLGVIVSGTLLVVLLFRETKATTKLLAVTETAQTTAHEVADRLSAILNSSVVGIVTIDAGGVITSFNPAAERLFGYSADFAVSRNVSLLMPESEIPAHDRALTKYPSANARKVIGKTREVLARRSDGTIFPAEVSVGTMTIDGTISFVGFIVEISERKQAENALKASEQRFRDIAEIAGDWIWETDRDNRFTYFSGQMEKITGLDAKNILGKTRRDLPWADDGDPKWQKLHKRIALQKPFRDFSFEVGGPDIGTRHMRISGNPIFDAEGNFDGYRGTGTDVTAQIEAEREAAQKTGLLQTTFDNIVEGINVVDGDGRVVAFNSRFLELLDLPPGTVVTGMPFEQIARYLASRGEYGPGDTEELVERRTNPARLDGPYTVEHRRPNGTVLEQRTNPLPGGGFATTYADVTDRKRVEEEFRQAQKMEAIGRLTAGIAHEFNNLLTAIGGFARLTLRHVDEPDTVREWSEDIVGAADQGAELTRQLLNFSHSQAPSPKLVRIGVVLREAAQLLRPTIGELISVNYDFADDRAQVRIDPGRLSQALINIVINAKDAMPQGGTLTIVSRVVELNETATAGFDHAQAGRYVMISIADTGAGIDQDTLKKMFEPFFTTKEVGKGTGLGLSMVYSTVQQSGGVIAVDSELGAGTTFKIYLPLAESAEETDDEPEGGGEDEGDTGSADSEAVLVAEDGVAARQLASPTPERRDSALPTARDRVTAADVTDLRGRFMTGYEGFSGQTTCGPIEIGCVLRKPIDFRQLAHAVHGALDPYDRPRAA